MTLNNLIENFFNNNFSNLPKSIAVAVSGGIDSLALTFLLDDFCKKNSISFYAITIDHKMRESSQTEALSLHKILQKNKIKHEILTFDKKDLPKNNIEANLRELRYDLLYSFCIKHKIENLFLGHHLGDVAENFLIRLFRGSQIDGLSSMQEVSNFNKIKLCRPLLNIHKDELKKYLEDKKITWFEDESNEDEKFLRNKIRKFFEQFEEKNLIQKRIKNAAENIFETKEMIDEILLREALKFLSFNEDGSFLINKENYQKTQEKIAQKILSLLLIEVSGNIYKPRLIGLKNFEKNILSLKKGQKKNFYGCMAKIVQGQANLDIAAKNGKQKITREENILIYRDENEAKNPTKDFDEKTLLIDGRFLVKNNIKDNIKAQKFYFRTILGKIFPQ